MKKFMKRGAALLLAFCLLAGGAGILSLHADALVAYGDFADLSAKAEMPWYVNYLNKSFLQGFYYGVSRTAFEPDRAITRGEAVTVLGRVHERLTGTTIPEASEKPFEDVEITQYYARHIAWAKENSIVSGVTDVSFAPHRAVTQEEIAVMLASYIQYMDRADAFAPVEELDVSQASDWAQASIKAISGFELMPFFQPKSPALRGECAAYFVELYERLSYPLDDETPRQKFTYSAPETAYEAWLQNGTQYRMLNSAALWGDGYCKGWQVIEDYDAYRELVAKLNAQGEEETQTVPLAVSESTFADKKLLAVEMQAVGEPGFKADLGKFTVGAPAGSFNDDESAQTLVKTTMVCSGTGGSTADIDGCVFFLEIPADVHVDPVEVLVRTGIYNAAP